jgi:hypothetical protein
MEGVKLMLITLGGLIDNIGGAQTIVIRDSINEKEYRIYAEPLKFFLSCKDKLVKQIITDCHENILIDIICLKEKG